MSKAAIKARNEQTDEHGPVIIYTEHDGLTNGKLDRPEYGKAKEVRIRSQKELQVIAQGGPTNRYEMRERYALENLKCFDCEIDLQKLSAGDYFCPSCGDQFSE
jgi:hypothetical protein